MKSKNRFFLINYYRNFIVLLFVLFSITTATINAQIAKGADVGWLSFFESSLGISYLNDQGQIQDALEILRDHDMSAIRLRAFVNPTQETIGEVDTEGVVKNAVRANNLDLDVMITIHYSDTWADPGNQTKPAAWQNLTFNELSQAVYDYTYQLLDALLKAGVTPKWVQVGNEVDPGFIWEDGRLAQSNSFANMSNFVTLSNRGYDAIKDRSPTTQVITHLASGNNISFLTGFFDAFYSNGGKNDIIGISYYPRWHGGTIQDVGNNLNFLADRFNKNVMICEIGDLETEKSRTYNMLVDAIDLVEAIPNNRGLGVFYWEPISHSTINGYQQGLAIPISQNQYQFSWVLDAFLEGAENCTPILASHHVQIDGGPWEQTSDVVAYVGGIAKLSPKPAEETGWSWKGPNGFSANTREIELTQLQRNQAGDYVATYIPDIGCPTELIFSLGVYEVGEIVIENPGFELGEVAPWVGTGNYGVDTDLKKSGTYSGWFGGGISELHQTITGLLPNTTYEYSCYIRNWSGDNGVVTVGVRNYGSAETTTSVGITGNFGNDFELAQVSFTTGSTDTSAVIYVSTTQAQTWGKLDDVRVIPESATLSNDLIENNKKNKLFTIYPNPASENITIRANNPTEKVSLTIYNLEGKKVLNKIFNTNNSNMIDLPISQLSKGVFLIKLVSKSGVFTTKKLLIK